MPPAPTRRSRRILAPGPLAAARQQSWPAPHEHWGVSGLQIERACRTVRGRFPLPVESLANAGSHDCGRHPSASRPRSQAILNLHGGLTAGRRHQRAVRQPSTVAQSEPRRSPPSPRKHSRSNRREETTGERQHLPATPDPLAGRNRAIEQQRLRIEMDIAPSRAQNLDQRRIASDRGSIVPSTGTSSVPSFVDEQYSYRRSVQRPAQLLGERPRHITRRPSTVSVSLLDPGESPCGWSDGSKRNHRS